MICKKGNAIQSVVQPENFCLKKCVYVLHSGICAMEGGYLFLGRLGVEMREAVLHFFAMLVCSMLLEAEK